MAAAGVRVKAIDIPAVRVVVVAVKAGGIVEAEVATADPLEVIAAVGGEAEGAGREAGVVGGGEEGARAGVGEVDDGDAYVAARIT